MIVMKFWIVLCQDYVWIVFGIVESFILVDKRNSNVEPKVDTIFDATLRAR